MKKTFLTILLLVSFNFAFSKTSLITKNVQKKRTPSADINYFADASADLQKLLAHHVFKSYAEYTIDNVRQGEIGESQAYFVRLEKPFSATSEGMCFVFLGTQDLQDKPHKCNKAE